MLTSLNSKDAAPAVGASARVLLRTEALRKSFGGQVVLDDIEHDLRQGEVVLLRGENGSGKTTLLNILTGNLEPDAGSIAYLADNSPRTYSFPRRWWQELNPFDHFTPEFVAREGLGRTWQDVRLFGAQSLRDNIAVADPAQPGENPVLALFAPGFCSRREADINRDADLMLTRLGLDGRETSSADKISLGQSKRVAIARAIAAGAKVLFLDEPLAGLDRNGVAGVLSLLKSLVRDHSVTLVIVEHVFNFVHLHHLVTVHWLLENGKLVKNHVDPIPQVNDIERIEVAVRPPWLDLLAHENSQILDEKLPRGAVLTRIRENATWQSIRKPVLEINRLVVKRGSRIVVGLDDESDAVGLDLTLYAGEIAILQAPNGWGKSTLFAALFGLIPATSGTVRVQQQFVDKLTTWERVGKGLHGLPSDHHVFPNLRVRECLQLARKDKDVAELDTMINRTTSALSGGQKQFLAINASRPITNTLVQIIDEPFSMLDSATIPKILRFLRPTEATATLLLFPTSSKS